MKISCFREYIGGRDWLNDREVSCSSLSLLLLLRLFLVDLRSLFHYSYQEDDRNNNKRKINNKKSEVNIY